MSGALLEARDLLFRRGERTILDIPSLFVGAGEALAVIGPNGAGKSTLLMCLAGLWKPDRGEVLRLGEPIARDLLAYRRRNGVVFQEPLLLDSTVYENVAVSLRLRKIKGDEAHIKAQEALRRFKIERLAQRRTKTLSGGEAQRVSLARAFAAGPEIIFLDEPFSALDAPTREGLVRDLHRNLRETGTTAVLVTHDLGEALRLSDRLLVIRKGRVAQAGTPEEVVNRPVDPEVAGFVGMETLIKGVVAEASGGFIEVLAGGCRITAVAEGEAGEEVFLGVRPENVTVMTGQRAEISSARNVFEGMVVRTVPQGPVTTLELDCGFVLHALLTSRSVSELGIAEGSRVTASLKATSIHVIRHPG